MSSVYRLRNQLYFSLKVNGKWKGFRSPYKVGQERLAKAALERLEVKLAEGELPGELGAPTVAAWSKVWLTRRSRAVRTWKNDRGVMRLHVLPTLGELRLDDVRPLHIVKLIAAWRARSGTAAMAPKSVYNAYSSLCALFRDAALEGLIDRTPCILTEHQLGPKVDSSGFERPKAQFGRAELEQLISDERVPMDRRVYYALCGIGALRYGEASGLPWRHTLVPVPEYPGTPPMLYVTFAYERPTPKGDVPRPVPAHPALASLLSEWKLFGWQKMFGRAPKPDDLVVPLPVDAVSKRGRWRRKEWVRKHLVADLEMLELRHRRGHDLRRTMISLARSSGARTEILKRATHRPPREVIEGYTTFEWPVVCAEVLKLQVQRRGAAQVSALSRRSAVGEKTLESRFLRAEVKAADQRADQVWRSPDSNGGAAGSNSTDSARFTSVDLGSQRETAEGRHAGRPIDLASHGRKVESPGRKLRPLVGGRVRPFRKSKSEG